MAERRKKKINIRDLVSILRSKNAGPLYLGFDLIFKDEKGYQLGKRYITKQMIADLYNVPVDRIADLIPYDPGRGIKITLVRSAISGDPEDMDVYGSQQHVPLLRMEIPSD
jgi:hypothetical protein